VEEVEQEVVEAEKLETEVDEAVLAL